METERQRLSKKLAEFRLSPDYNIRQGESLAVIIADIYYPEPETKHNRLFPRMTKKDTFCFRIEDQDLLLPYEFLSLSDYIMHDYLNNTTTESNPIKDRILTRHGYALSIEDEDIEEVLELSNPHTKEEELDNWTYRGNIYGFPVYVQDGIRNCVHTCAAMLVSHKTNKIILPEKASLGNDAVIERLANKHDCFIKTTSFPSSGHMLGLALDVYGPAKIDVTTTGGHAVILLRHDYRGYHIVDPYHGWAIIVKEKSFSKYYNKKEIEMLHVFKNGEVVETLHTPPSCFCM